MTLILDTHILLWVLTDSEALPPRARDLLLDPSNQFFASAISIWEIAIKFARNRGNTDDMPINAARAVQLVDKAGMEWLPVTAAHARMVDELPVHHRDPFDRLLVAQAKSEPMHLLTADKRLAAYGHPVLLV